MTGLRAGRRLQVSERRETRLKKQCFVPIRFPNQSEIMYVGVASPRRVGWHRPRLEGCDARAVSASKTKTTLRSSWGHMHRCAASIIAPVAEEVPDPAAPNGAAPECTVGGSFAPRAAAYGCLPKWQCACSVEHACLTQAPDQGPNAESRPASGASLERSGVRRRRSREDGTTH